MSALITGNIIDFLEIEIIKSIFSDTRFRKKLIGIEARPELLDLYARTRC